MGISRKRKRIQERAAELGYIRIVLVLYLFGLSSIYTCSRSRSLWGDELMRMETVCGDTFFKLITIEKGKEIVTEE